MTHELKIFPQYYKAVADGLKTFEWRKDDRGFKEGDIVILREWDGEYKDSVGLQFKIGFILRFVDHDHVIFSLLECNC